MSQPRNVSDLCSLVAGGTSPSLLFFWGHRPSRDGSITKTCLSQWYESPFEVDGIRYRTAEHFMMAEKARIFGDKRSLVTILQASSPGAAKAAGRSVAGFDEELWRKCRSKIVIRGNLAKFTQNQELKAFLLSTGDRVLVEASPTDIVWGIGLEADNPSALNPDRWRGLNLLGFALMEVRFQLAVANKRMRPT